MIELIDTHPDVGVAWAEYKRLLGYPHDRVLDQRAAELASQARAWYEQRGRPWVYARQTEHLEIGEQSIRIDGVPFSGKRLRNMLQEAVAHSVILMAVGAGPELEQDASRLWRADKPDEYFFLDVFGSTVVEHLTATTGARLCAWAEQRGMAVLPHDSPGYPGWDVGEQARLLALLKRAPSQPWPSPIEALESGALRPKKSQLAVFGVTRHTDRLRRHTGLVACEDCSFVPCQYRRAPHHRLPTRAAADARRRRARPGSGS